MRKKLERFIERILSVFFVILLIPIIFLLPFAILLYYIAYLFFNESFLMSVMLLNFFDMIALIVFIVCVCIGAGIIQGLPQYLRNRKSTTIKTLKAFRKVRPSLEEKACEVTLSRVENTVIDNVIGARAFVCTTSDERELEIICVEIPFFTFQDNNARRSYEGEHGTIRYYEYMGKNYFERFVENKG